MNDIPEKRQALIRELFPAGVPRLWCPLLTHYRPDGRIDADRMSAHLNFVAPWVKGFLIPGSTGDGWELNDGETREVVEFALRKARERDVRLLLGALKTDTEGMQRTISDMLQGIKKMNPTDQPATTAALRNARVCGLTVCPPRGKSLSQDQIAAALSRILDLGMPTALYQLPQVTENEVSPETFEKLARRYANLVFFKDSSGRDAIATAAIDHGGVFLVRGAEGDYAQWLKDAGGRYDGFLLSTANCFPKELHDLIDGIEKGEREKAGLISARLTGAVREVFDLVQTLPSGNAFTNANKAMDHFFAFGPAAPGKDGPLLHSGIRIPGDIIAATGPILARYHLMPEKGYLA